MIRQLNLAGGLRLLACLGMGLFAVAIVAGPASAQPAAGDLVINEIDYDQPGTDTAEFIELFNKTGASIDLSVLEVRLVNGSGGTVYKTIPLTGTLAAGGYFVICANAANTANCNLDESPNTDLVQNGAPDAVAIVVTASGAFIDVVSYEGDTAGYFEGTGAGLIDSGAGTVQGISRFPNGTDTNNNAADLSLRLITPGAANSATLPAELTNFAVD